jgi:AcrR family transcriptional regulator
VPKLTDARQRRQADHIRAAAENCFAQGGFHATSMDEIIAEAGVSSSTVYRYYPGGKQELIRVVSEARIAPLLDRIAALAADDSPPPREQAFLEGISILWPQSDSDGAGDSETRLRYTRLVLNAWNEISRDPQIAEMFRENHDAIRAEITLLVHRWQETGVVTASLGAEEIAALLHTVAFGLVVEQVITGSADIIGGARRLSKLLSPASD